MTIHDHRSTQAVLKSILRKDLSSFIAKSFNTIDGSQAFLPNWHIDLIADHLVKAYRREIKRLVITMPPRNLKSISASVAFVAWALGNDPSLKFVTASYSNDLSLKHARDCRSVMQSEWYKDVFPATRLFPGRMAEDDFETTAGGGRLSTSVGGTLTGRGGDFIIIDDPIKPQDSMSAVVRSKAQQWLSSTVGTRLNSKNDGVIILIMQRLHVDDPVSHVLEKGGWVHLNLPAIAEENEQFVLADGRAFSRSKGVALHPIRESIAALERQKAEMGALFFSAQYQQRPVAAEGNLFKGEWFTNYTSVPRTEYSCQIVQAWDTAMTDSSGADYSVATTWIIEDCVAHLFDVYRARLQVPALKRKIADYKNQFEAGVVLIEISPASIGLIQQLEFEKTVFPVGIKPVGDKIQRAASVSAMIEAGRVRLPHHAPWLDEFRAEVLAFPASRYDDQVDSMTLFLNWFARNRGPIYFG